MNSLIFDRNLPQDSFARQRALGVSRVALMWERIREWLLADFMPEFSIEWGEGEQKYEGVCGSGC